MVAQVVDDTKGVTLVSASTLQAIAWHLVQTLKPKVPVRRMVFHEITQDAINASLSKTIASPQSSAAAGSEREAAYSAVRVHSCRIHESLPF